MRTTQRRLALQTRSSRRSRAAAPHLHPSATLQEASAWVPDEVLEDEWVNAAATPYDAPVPTAMPTRPPRNPIIIAWKRKISIMCLPLNAPTSLSLSRASSQSTAIEHYVHCYRGDEQRDPGYHREEEASSSRSTELVV